MCELEIIMCEEDLERCEDKIVMDRHDKVKDVYKRNKCNCYYFLILAGNGNCF